MSGASVPAYGATPPVAAVQDATEEAAPASQAPPIEGTAHLGHLVRLRVLQPKDLPEHPDFAAHQVASEQPRLPVFLRSILAEGRSFVTSYWPKHFEVKGKEKPSPPSAAHVELFTHELRAAELPAAARTAGVTTSENWFARTTIHENAAQPGTASWEEFDGGLRANHSQHEKDYTPNVYDAHEVLSWPVIDELDSEDGRSPWTEVRAVIVEMAHQMPGPLADRVFKVLVVTAKRAEEFLVVQIPVDTATLANAKYNDAKKTTTGVYVSIEFGQLVDNGSKVKWQMGTASDAKGVLPMWAQKLGVPGAVVKDVGLFIGWCEKRRKGQA